MAERILMAALSPTMEEGVIAKWNKKEGDKVKEGDVICEVETDKATVEYEATFEGTILKITKGVGSQTKVGEMIGVFGKEGEDFSALLTEAKPTAPNATAGVKTETKPEPAKDNAKYDYDLVVIGSGPGGYVSAIRASQLGLKVAIVEKDREGGVCLNWGCIPTKALIHQAEIFNYVKEAPYMGIKIDQKSFNYSEVQQKSRNVSDELNKGVIFLLKKNKVEVFKGYGSLLDAHNVAVEGTNGVKNTINTKNILLATGSRPRQIPGFEFDEKLVLSSTGFLDMKDLPKSMIIIGAGVIGMEIGFILNSFGVEVTVLEMLPNIIPTEDADAVKVVEDHFKKQGVKIRKEVKTKNLKKLGTHIEIDTETKDGKVETLKADKILISIGRSPNVENMGLEKVGVKLDSRGGVIVHDYYKTDIENIFAIGDIVLSTPLLAHVASKEGEIAVEYMAGHEHEKFIKLDEIPAAIYTTPEIASFGPNEKTCKEKGIEYTKFMFPYQAVGKTVAVEKKTGFAKVLVDKKTKEVISAVIVGYTATELIHEILLAKKSELLPEDIATMIHAHPTISEVNMEVMRGIEGWAIHI